jgi:hypothetical protein
MKPVNNTKNLFENTFKEILHWTDECSEAWA